MALLGPRQVGKVTFAKVICKKISAVYLDLESPEDLIKLTDPLLFLSQRQGKLIVIDEIQRKPDLFTVLRVLVYKARQSGDKKA